MDYHEKYSIAIASLIRDFGKLGFKSGEYEPGLTSEKISNYIFDEYISNKECLKDLKESIKSILENKEGKKYSTILNADQLTEEMEKNGDSVNDKFPLVSILSKVVLDEKNLPVTSDIFYFKPQELTYENIFPEKIENEFKLNENEIYEDYKKLYKDFLEDLKEINGKEIRSFTESLFQLAEKYLTTTSFSGSNNLNDVSLYDHAKSVAALSICKEYSDNPEKAFLIVTADISGIQKFIYNEIEVSSTTVSESKGKRLRGKSFYLSLITDLFSDYILNQFDLPKANLLMNGGGHFIILLPNSEENKVKLEEVKRNTQDWFYKNFKSELNLIIETLEADDELYKDFPLWYTKISGKLNEAKKHLSIERLDEVFKFDLDKMDVSEYKLQLNKTQKEVYEQKSGEYEKNMYLLASLFEMIGEVLPKTKYIVEVYAKSDSISEINFKTRNFVPFPYFNYGYFFAKDSNDILAILKSWENIKIDLLRVLKINDTDYLEIIDHNLKEAIRNAKFAISLGYKFIGNHAPKLEDGSVATFEEISIMNNEDGVELRYPLLATVRMDVDNLGAIFSLGLERETTQNSIRTLSRTVALSREFNRFFGGYLNKIAERWNMYITYSGGDDLFAVGSWINAMGFALQVREDFRKFACGNPNLSISAGVHLHKPNYPIGKAAELAGEAEDIAKKTDKNSFVKDKICIFGKPFTWDEYKKYYEYGKDLDSVIEKDKSNKENKNGLKASFIHFLLQQSKMMFDENDSFDINKYFEIIFKLKYHIARRNLTASKLKAIEEGKETDKKSILLSKLINDKDSTEYIKNFIVPASYVILKNRQLNNQGE